ncbi:MAG: sugar phosphate nucleotidyltransferase [Candidatus Hodarchaeales archaeon]|jgi:dTDP-glucose pyrophosphorylase
MKAFILCAGKGTRLLPLTYSIPKPLLPLLDKPFFDHVVSMLRYAGITEIGVVINFLKESFLQLYDQENYDFIEQEKLLGTGHAILQLEKHIKEGESFIVSAGDNLFPSSHVFEMVEKIQEPDVDGMVSIIEMPPFRIINQMATVKFDNNYQLLEIVEKPPKEEVLSPYGTAALWAFKSSIFPALKQTKLSPRGELEIQSAIQSLIDQGKVIKCVPLLEDSYMQLTSLEDLYHLNIRFLKEKGLDNWVHDSVILEEGALVSQSVIGAGSEIKKGVVLDRVVVLPGTIVKSSTSRALICKKRFFSIKGE